MKKAHAVAERVMLKLGDEVEKQYRAERAMAAEDLHGAIIEAINKQRPTVETVIYVVEMVKAQVLRDMQQQVFTPADEVGIGRADEVEHGLEEAATGG